MTFAEALEADRAEDIERAAELYEEAHTAGDASLDLLINLAVLYWQATDPGLAAAKHLSRDFLDRAYRRTRELLREAGGCYPTSQAPRFWQRYIAWADLGEELTIEDCYDFLRAEPAYLEPAVHIFGTTEGARAANEAAELLKQAKAAGTVRGGYVASVIEGVLHRTRRRK
jgi:hypothetical protein